MTVIDRTGNVPDDLAVKAPCTVATTANITLSGLQTIDGVAVVENMRVLVKDQTDDTENGIYQASTGTWSRPNDANGNLSFIAGTQMFIAEGAVNGGETFAITTTDDPIVVGTSSMTFVLVSVIAALNQTATSATSLALTTGAKALAVQANKNFAAKLWVIIFETSNPDNSMLGEIASYVGTALVVNVIAVAGAGGPYNDWTVVLTNSPAAAGRQPPVGSGNTTGAASSTAGHLAVFADATGKVIADGGLAGTVANLNSVDAAHVAASAIAFGVPMLNGYLVESHNLGALTVAVKTVAGADPSAADPVIFLFRSATLGDGSYVMRTVIAPLSLTISAGSTLNFSNNVAGSLWIEAFDDAGTVRLAVMNARSGINVYPLAGWQVASTLADDGAGGSDLPQVFYTANGHALASCAYAIIGRMTWENGLAVAGTWNASPRIDSRPKKLPGDEIQTQSNITGAVNTGNTILPRDNSTPQSTEGTEFLTQKITASSQANIFEFEWLLSMQDGASNSIAAALFQDTNANALAVGDNLMLGIMAQVMGRWAMPTAGVAGETTFKIRGGDSSGGTCTFNGSASAGLYNNTISSYLIVREKVG